MKKIGFLQFAVEFGQPTANRDRVVRLLSGIGDVDLMVLPELAFTGYDFVDAAELSTLAEPFGNGPTSDFLRQISQEHNAVVVAGYAERSGDKLYNSAMIASAGEVIANYRKIHLFSRENELFSRGDQPPAAVDTPAGRIGVMICFDWFFPEVARSLALDGAQIIAHPSNLVLPWCQRAMFARCVENHLYAVTANRIGREERVGRELIFTGGSQVMGFGGEVLASAGAGEETARTVDLDLAAADNKLINPWNDLLAARRPELYRL